MNDYVLAMVWTAWAVATTPLAFMLGSSCSPCCGGCPRQDLVPRSDPVSEGTWVPSGDWPNVTWTFAPNDGNTPGETWFFFGSQTTSSPNVAEFATTEQQRDWNNPCNWYSNKSSVPSFIGVSGGAGNGLDKRATRLPPENAVVHFYSPVSTATAGPQTIKAGYFWDGSRLVSGTINATGSAHGTLRGFVVNFNTRNEGTLGGGARFIVSSWNALGATVNGGADFTESTFNYGTVNDGATFSGVNAANDLGGVVNGGAVFNDETVNTRSSVVNGGATFNDESFNREFAVVNGGATFNGSAVNSQNAIVNDGATFNDNASNFSTVNDGATFNDTSANQSFATVNGGATFNDNSTHVGFATVNGGATFNDAACSTRQTGSFSATPCSRKFVAHPTDLPTCNGTAPSGCDNAADTCGCG